MVHGLLVGKPYDRRQDAERVGREEEDVLRMSGRSGNQRIGDVPHGVRGPRVLGQPVRIVVRVTVFVEDDILDDRTETDRAVDLGFRFAGELDAFGVAPPLEVEDPVRTPSVFVVADEPAGGIGRERRLSRSGQPEEERRVAAHPDVRGAVHR